MKPGPLDKNVADRMPGLVLLLDAAGAVIHANPAFSATLGEAPEALAGRNLLALVHPDDAEPARDWLRAGAQGRAEAVLRLGHADGSWRSLEALAAPLAIVIASSASRSRSSSPRARSTARCSTRLRWASWPPPS